MTTQPMAAAAAANWVLTKALVASGPAFSALPALKPNQPTHSRAGADEAEHHGVGRHILLRVAGALAQIEGADQGGDAAVMWTTVPPAKSKNRPAASGDVQDSAHAPDHVGHGAVNNQRPEEKKDGHGAELDALGKGAGDERRGDDGEHELVDHEGLLGDGAAVVGVGRPSRRRAGRHAQSRR
jgi:hypothetical protein